MAEGGWYPDPSGEPGRYRYWDGARWSAETSTDPGITGSSGMAGDRRPAGTGTQPARCRPRPPADRCPGHGVDRRGCRRGGLPRPTVGSAGGSEPTGAERFRLGRLASTADRRAVHAGRLTQHLTGRVPTR
ncbi:DUF2510 domain-containing protein [Microlunatus sp. Gsoil 973]|uniref:DUF2510 domain-containing protein n=1 Tax=Microlunatus sp. Gsoil 973 TaxID=2672569 RepID=UPI0012B48B08|nr:DUF2510 domain-containing protein [Microlunatus sp. Gsoil 973]